MKSKLKILAIESSCDETAAAVIGEDEAGNPIVLSNIVSSQVDLHAKTGGVVPEVASRAHMEAINPVIALALLEAQQQEISNSKFLISNQAPNSNHKNDLKFGNSDKNSKLKTDNYQEAISLLGDITHIAVTNGPGLIGSLLAGFNAAKTIAYSRDLPIIPINHIEGHIYSSFAREITLECHPELVSGSQDKGIPDQVRNDKSKLDNIQYQILNADFQFPILALTVSGGHTSLTIMRDHGKYETIGTTIDDAVGEAYDKVARLLELGYPGGSAVSKLASKFRESEVRSQKLDGSSSLKPQTSNRIVFPRPIMHDGTFNFSLSGLKTAVLQKVIEFKKNSTDLDDNQKMEITAAFEEAVLDVLSFKLINAAKKHLPKVIIMAGGVSANGYLREHLEKRLQDVMPDISFKTPPMALTGDNAAMIGLAAYYHVKSGDIQRWNEIHTDSNLKLSSLCEKCSSTLLFS